MIRLVEQKLEHTFGTGWTASKYDEWPFYKKHFQWSWVPNEPGNKSVDFVAVDPAGDSLWLIELKDYRLYRRTKNIPLPDEIAFKVRDSLAGLFAAAKHDAHHAHAADAQRSLQAKRIRVVLHLEQPRQTSRLFPRAYNLADVQQKLKQRVRGIDAHPVVTEIGARHSLPWSFRSIP
jgi:hypothetical protein